MSSHPIFTGAATALITPMTQEGVDYQAMGRLIDWQIDEGIDALVICGTSGESSTLTDKEHKECIRFAVERAAGRVPIIAGTGSNDTVYAMELTKFACSVGADACLVVTPYYNKATQKGLIRHYTAIADVSTKPLIVYNVPSRTSTSIEPATYLAMSEHPNIRAIKEANSDIAKIVRTAALLGDKMDIYSGNDDQIVPIMSMGGKGVISVLSNIMPKATSEMCHKFLRGDVAGAAADQCRYVDLISALFSEVNPIPVKAAAAKMGLCENYLRLPLTEMEPEHAEKLFSLMAEQGLI